MSAEHHRRARSPAGRHPTGATPDAAEPADRPPESADEAAEQAGEAARRLRERAEAAEVARQATRNALAIGVDEGLVAGPGPRLAGPPHQRWGWREAARQTVRRRLAHPRVWAYAARLAWQRATTRNLVVHGMVFLGPRVVLRVAPDRARMVLGAWAWVGAGCKLRAHEGQLRVGDKVVTGQHTIVNAYLDVEIGRDALLSDWIYISDFDHRFDDLATPVRKQGIVCSPTRVGEDVWIGEKVSVLRGARIGTGSVIGSQAVVRGEIPPFSIAVGAPARVVRSRLPEGMRTDEALALQRRGEPIPGDPLGW